MKILTIHADFIEFEARKKAFKAAEEGIKEGKQRVEECLVIFTAVEKRDEENPQGVAERYVQEIKAVAEQVKAKNIVLYPYAHLSSQLSSPAVAEKMLKDAEVLLKRENYVVSRAPFGWYKAFTVANKGHPLSELSREFTVGKEEKQEKQRGTESKEETKSSGNLQREYKDEPFVFNPKKLTTEEKINLSATLIIAKAVKELFPQAAIGSSNFYHDQAFIDLANITLKNEDIPRIEKKKKKILAEKISFITTSADKVTDALQKEIMKDLGKNAQPYLLGSHVVVPLFKEPFISSSKEIKSLKILNLASAYWKNNEQNNQLIRIYSVAFSDEKLLEEFLHKREEAEQRSHLKIGKEQGLFVVSELVGAGMPLLAPKGTILKRELTQFLWDLHKQKGYQQVSIPHIAKDSLYKKSGHWEKFGDELFHVKGRYEQFVLKPMNCPHHIQIFSAFSYSYRDLPVRFFEPTTVYRDEKPGQLVGLSRVRAITQDDGHLFCRISQIKQEVKTIVEIILAFYRTFNMDKNYWVSLSVRGEDHSKYLGTPAAWEIAELSLEQVAQENKLPYKKIKGEAAFYGPKLDFMFKDALGREWQLATIQLDFNQPERFELSFMNEEGKKERPVMIHRAISGSLERFMSILIEHFAGKFPLWLQPVQVKVLTVADRNILYAQEVLKKLQEMDIRGELDTAAETIGKKVRNAQLEKVNYIVTIGDKEMEQKTLAVRTREGEVTFAVPLEKFMQNLQKEIKEKK
ncbi:threonine--tRNA ligase [Candidatus Woesearchaeota archaeon]|nr:threonine--tRNA ligase [Candidatus Woesearchaeota archaeon]